MWNVLGEGDAVEATFWRIDEASQWKSEFMEVLFLLQGSPRPCVLHGVGGRSLEELSAQLPAFCTVSASKEQPSQSLASGDTGLSQDSTVGVLSPEGEPAHFCHKHCADCPGSAWQWPRCTGDEQLFPPPVNILTILSSLTTLSSATKSLVMMITLRERCERLETLSPLDLHWLWVKKTQIFFFFFFLRKDPGSRGKKCTSEYKTMWQDNPPPVFKLMVTLISTILDDFIWWRVGGRCWKKACLLITWPWSNRQGQCVWISWWVLKF